MTDTFRAITSSELADVERTANVRAGLCGCGCPASPSGRRGWRRCIWSTDVEFRLRRGKITYRSRASLEERCEWNNVKERSGLIDDREVHALLLFLNHVGS